MLVCMLHLLNSELGLLSTLPPVNTVSAECFACGTLCARGTLPTSAKDIVAHSKSITASVFYKKSVPSRPAASVGNEHTRNE